MYIYAKDVALLKAGIAWYGTDECRKSNLKVESYVLQDWLMQEQIAALRNVGTTFFQQLGCIGRPNN